MSRRSTGRSPTRASCSSTFAARFRLIGDPHATPVAASRGRLTAMKLAGTLIGMVRLPPLPGSPRWEGSMDRVAAAALDDARALVEGGLGALLVENYGDAPFTTGRVAPATVAAMGVIAAELRHAFPKTPLGVNVLKNDARAALAIACVVGGRFIRVNVHAGAVVADQGIVQTTAYRTLRDRRLLGADVKIFADVGGKHAQPLVPVELEQTARDLVHRGLADPLDPARLLALEPELGQLLLVGFQGTELEGNAPLEALLCEARVGGVVLFARNIVDAEQLARLAAALQARARACTGRALLVAVDAEGGQVMRLAPRAGFTGTLSAQELGETNDFTLTELEARRIARMLRAAGINWDLAPVVDVGYNPANPVIVGAARSFSANPLLVTAHARAFVRGMRDEGGPTPLKHLPGHASSSGDSPKL